MTQDEFVKQEWREKADRRNPELRKWRESVEFDIRMTVFVEILTVGKLSVCLAVNAVA